MMPQRGGRQQCTLNRLDHRRQADGTDHIHILYMRARAGKVLDKKVLDGRQRHADRRKEIPSS